MFTPAGRMSTRDTGVRSKTVCPLVLGSHIKDNVKNEEPLNK